MNARLFLCCALLVCCTLQARPLVIESHDRLPLETGWVGHWGDELIAVEVGGVAPNPGQFLFTYSANLYRRGANGQWTFDHTLAYETSPQSWNPSTVVMTASTVAIAMVNGLRIFERSGANWVESTLDVLPRPRGAPLDLHGSTILATDQPANLADGSKCAQRVLMLNRAGNGHWFESANIPVPANSCVTALDLDVDSAIVRSRDLYDANVPSTVRIFERSGSGWIQAAELPNHDEFYAPYFGRALAIHAGLALVVGIGQGTHVYRRGAAGWAETGHFPPSDDMLLTMDQSLQITDQYVLRVAGSTNRNTVAAYLYRQRADQSFEPLANLFGDRTHYQINARLQGSRVFTWGDAPNQPVEFNLPASFAVPPMVQNDFESNGAPALTPLPGSAFAIVSNGTTHVYRQSSLAGDAGATLAPDYTDQHISADIRLNGVSGADRWVGLVVRHVDEANFYYVTLRDSNRIVLKRMLNGVFTELGSAPIDVSVGQTYRIGLEASGTHLGVDVDGQRVIHAWDSQLTHGRAGVRSYRAAADFDNVVLTPGPRNDMTWTARETTGGYWSGTIQMIQMLADGDARLTSGYPVVDQVAQSVITTNWSSGGPGSWWVGLMVRYVDPGNFYYVTARQTGQLSLRKVTNGVITVLGTVPFSVESGTPFVLRLEAVGDKLRVYANDVLRLERAGASLVPGKTGLATYRSGAHFDYYTAYEP